jgi:flavin reductase (DIM6/NTAB) family NADH-FMN oxidoreductase RutF
MRTDFDPETLSSTDFYRLLTAVVVPRPIAWVSTLSGSGVANLAPHSFYTVACVSPPIVQFTSVGRNDTLRNVEQTREFVVSLVPESLLEQANATATRFPPDTSEFESVGVQREPSVRVGPPRVAQSPVALECSLHSTLCLGDSTIVFGRVVHAAVDADVLQDGHPTIERLAPVARLGRNEWSGIGELREISRIPIREWPGHYDRG